MYGFIIIFSQLDFLLIADPQFISAPVKRSRDRLPYVRLACPRLPWFIRYPQIIIDLVIYLLIQNRKRKSENN